MEGGQIKMEGKIIKAKDLTSDCFPVQFFGLEACDACDLFETPQCGGKRIIQKIGAGQFPKDGLPGIKEDNG